MFKITRILDQYYSKLLVSIFFAFQALETVNNSKETYEKTWKDIKVKHTAQKDEMEMKMVKIVTNGTKKILEDKIQEVDKAYDPACQKLSDQAEMISNYLQKVEKSLQRTNDVLENSKLEELLSAQKIIDDDIRMLQNERPQNLTTFQIQVENEESCMKKLRFFTLIKELSANCKYTSLQFGFVVRVAFPLYIDYKKTARNLFSLINHLAPTNLRESWRVNPILHYR
jgi:hypothetical protein